MKLRTILIAFALSGCNVNVATVPPAVDSGPLFGDAGPLVDAYTAPEHDDAGSPDAWEAPDGALELDAGPDAWLEEPDAYVAPELSREDACSRSAAAYAATSCNADFYVCRFTGPTPEARVVTCEEAIAFGFSEAAGPSDMGSRCARAIEAASRCSS